MTISEIGTLYEEHNQYLITLIKSRLFDGCPKDVAYDCLEEVFIIAMEKRNDPKFNFQPKPWLINTTKFVVDNYNRKHVNRMGFYDFECEIDDVLTPKDLVEDLAFKMAIEEDVLEKVKKDLSADDRVIFIMRFEQGKTTEQIGKELHMRRGAVSTRVTRIKEHVKQLVTKYVGQE